MKRVPRLEGDKVIIQSELGEEFSKKEFERIFAERNMEVQNIGHQLNQWNDKLEELDKIEETEELKKLKENLEKAEKLRERDKLVENIKGAERRLLQAKGELESFGPVAKQIKEAQQG